MDVLALVATPALAYLVLAAMVAVDAIFPTVPADLAVVTAGSLAATGGLSIGWVVVVVVLGAMAGDHAVYTVGRKPLPTLLDRTRFGRRLRDVVDRGYARVENVSTAALAMGRFIPFGRTASAATAGLVGVPLRRYFWISMLGASCWAVWIAGLGYLTGNSFDGPMWLQVLLATGVGVGAAVVIAAIQQLVVRRRSSSSTSPASAPEVLS